MESTNGAVHTHTLTIKNLGVGEEETYTCSVVFVENDQPKNLVTTLNKLCKLVTANHFLPFVSFLHYINVVIYCSVLYQKSYPPKSYFFVRHYNFRITILTKMFYHFNRNIKNIRCKNISMCALVPFHV